MASADAKVQLVSADDGVRSAAPNCRPLCTDAPFDTGDAHPQIPGATESLVTFVVEQEDHTLGNALRYSLMRE
jgi:hypothetical protein